MTPQQLQQKNNRKWRRQANRDLAQALIDVKIYTKRRRRKDFKAKSSFRPIASIGELADLSDTLSRLGRSGDNCASLKS